MRLFNRMTITTMVSVGSNLKKSNTHPPFTACSALRSVMLSISVLATLLLPACAEFPGVYKVNVEQGNIIEAESLDELVLGQTKEQVTFLLGSPLVVDTFTPDRWDYVYRIKHGDEFTATKDVVLYFENGELAKIER